MTISSAIKAMATSIMVSSLFVVPAATVFTLATADVAEAKAKGKSKGKGSGKGNGGSSRGSSSASGGNPGNGPGLFKGLFRRNEPAPVPKPTTAASVMNYAPAAPAAPTVEAGKGKYAAELKGLNAANASLQAFANASPNSQVGLIAIYRETRVDFEAKLDEIAMAEADYQINFGTAPRTLGEVESDIDALDPLSPTYDALNNELTALGDLATLYGERDGLETEMNGELADAAFPNDAPTGDAFDYFLSLLRLDEPLPGS